MGSKEHPNTFNKTNTYKLPPTGKYDVSQKIADGTPREVAYCGSLNAIAYDPGETSAVEGKLQLAHPLTTLLEGRFENIIKEGANVSQAIQILTTVRNRLMSSQSKYTEAHVSKKNRDPENLFINFINYNPTQKEHYIALFKMLQKMNFTDPQEIRNAYDVSTITTANNEPIPVEVKKEIIQNVETALQEVFTHTT